MSGVDGQTPGRTQILVTGAIIAGGTSRRMGMDKRGVLVDGIPLLRRVASTLVLVADELVVACRRDSPPDPVFLLPLSPLLVYDRLPDAGPLAGVEAALAAARGELVIVVACDMPWLAADVLRLLLAEAERHPEADAVALGTERGAEPLLCVYRRRVLPTVTGLLDSGQRRMHALLDAVAMVEVPPSAWHAVDPSGRTAVNLNAPTDLLRSPSLTPRLRQRSRRDARRLE